MTTLPLILSCLSLSLSALALLCLFFHGGRIERLDSREAAAWTQITKLMQRAEALERGPTEQDILSICSEPPRL